MVLIFPKVYKSNDMINSKIFLTIFLASKIPNFDKFSTSEILLINSKLPSHGDILVAIK